MEHFKYGTPEYYSELFSDIIADAEHPGAIQSILAGFELSINSWIDYHDSAHKHYRDLMMAFHSIKSNPSISAVKSGASK